MSTSRRIRKRNRRINNALLLILILTFLLTIAAFAVNIVRISKQETGEGETIETEVEPVEVGNNYSNDYYSIGYNATDVNKEYFRQLDQAVESENPVKTEIAGALVRCFVTEYYTWTNKDGNYDLGGMQYIYSDRRSDFEKYSRYGFYADMDLYLKQYNRSELIQVEWVSVSGVEPTDPYIFYNAETGEETALDCYAVSASWDYAAGTAMDTSAIQKSALFYVVDHDGRLEIAQIGNGE